MVTTTETLRRAAALMRERAQAANGGGKWPWKAEPDTMAGRVWVQMSRDRWVRSADCEPMFSVRSEEGYKQREADAQHIASFASPAIALAVADWLDAEARASVDIGATLSYALAVAAAYLNEEPSP